MKTKSEWLNETQTASLKLEILALLRETPRAKWADAIVREYACNAATRVAVFKIFSEMMESGELDKLKVASSVRARLQTLRDVPPRRFKR